MTRESRMKEWALRCKITKGSTPGTRSENGVFPVLSVEHIIPALNGD